MLQKKNAILLASYCRSAQTAAVLNIDDQAASDAKRRKAVVAQHFAKVEKRVDGPPGMLHTVQKCPGRHQCDTEHAIILSSHVLSCRKKGSSTAALL